MYYLKHRVKWEPMVLAGIITVSAFSSCNKKNLAFDNPQDAVNVCREELQEVKSMRSANIKELTNCVGEWQTIQDSVYNYLAKNKQIDKNGRTVHTFLIISDSIREEIGRLAFSESRSMSDVIYLKEHTAFNREKLVSTYNYQEAAAFFDDLDNQQLYQGSRQTLEEYAWLMTHTNNRKFRTEGEFKKFLQQEDLCFRSFLEHIHEVPPMAIKKLTIETSKFCENLYKGHHTNFMPQDKLTLYMTMRFNRRVLQNAAIYQKYIEDSKTISMMETGNYRWTLIQPMFSIDNYSMATMTDTQMKELSNLSEKLPELLAYIDKQVGTSPAHSQQLATALTHYFLTSYLRNTL